jgi:hypothetical protein
MSAQVIDLLKRNDDAARALRRAAHVYHTTPVADRENAENALYVAAMRYALCVVRPSIVEGEER